MSNATISIPASMIPEELRGKLKPVITTTNMGTGEQDLSFIVEINHLFLSIKNNKKS